VNNAGGMTEVANCTVTKFIRHCGEINAFGGFFCGVEVNCLPIFLRRLMLSEDPGSSTAFDGKVNSGCHTVWIKNEKLAGNDQKHMSVKSNNS